MEKQDEGKTVESVSQVPIVRNESDDPNILSVTTVTPLPDKVDELAKTEEQKKEEAEVTSETEKKEEEKSSEETLPKKVEEKLREKDPVQKRIDELTRKRRDAERERDFERTKRLGAEEEIKKLKSAVPQGDRPKIEDFETEVDYLEALADWKFDQKMQAEREKDSREKATEDEKAAIAEIYQELDGKMEKGRKKYDDFDELVLNEDLKISESMVEAILLSDTPEDVLYYLGKHPNECADIAELPPLKIAHELGKIEAKINAPPPKKKITSAPEPISPIKTTGVTEKRLEDLPPKEFRAAREAGRIT